MIRFVHTGDLQLGMPFNWVDGDAGSRLRQIRLDVIDQIARVCGEQEAQFLLVAGDLFDATSVNDRVVHGALERFGAFKIPVLVIPGNHDHVGDPFCPYNRAGFRASLPRNLVILDRPEPHLLDAQRCVILPAPLRLRHEYGDTTRHITAAFGAALAPGGFRIGLAHGSMLGMAGGEDGDAGDHSINEIAPDRAAQAKLDYLALGDWHGTKQIDHRTWYAGAPEPTSFKQNDPGNVLVVTVVEPGALPQVEKIRVARTRWLEHAMNIASIADVDALDGWFKQLPDRLDTLVRLELSGVLTYAELSQLNDVLQRWRSTLLHLRERGSGVRSRPTDGELQQLAGDGYVKVAVDKLRELSTAGTDSAATDALDLLFEIKAAQAR